ncbi:MAG: TetR/AcrR family transcriptional regulator [Candidatus Hodarchaeales archaeon]|jgi:AcrR family transcriptional regulator
MPRLTDAKEQIIKITRNKLHLKSYNSISYKEISDELGIKKASLYHHFPSKEELGLTVLQNYRKHINDLMKKTDEFTDDPWKKLKGYLRYFSKLREEDDKICLGGVLTTEYNTLPGSIQKELKLLFDDHFNWLVTILNDGREKNIFYLDDDPYNVAIMIEAKIQGGLILSRLLGNKHIDNIIEEIKRDLTTQK